MDGEVSAFAVGQERNGQRDSTCALAMAYPQALHRRRDVGDRLKRRRMGAAGSRPWTQKPSIRRFRLRWRPCRRNVQLERIGQNSTASPPSSISVLSCSRSPTILSAESKCPCPGTSPSPYLINPRKPLSHTHPVPTKKVVGTSRVTSLPSQEGNSARLRALPYPAGCLRVNFLRQQ